VSNQGYPPSQQGYPSPQQAHHFVSQSGYSPQTLLTQHVHSRFGSVQQASALHPQHKVHYSESYDMVADGSSSPAPQSSSFRAKVADLQTKVANNLGGLREFLTPLQEDAQAVHTDEEAEDAKPQQQQQQEPPQRQSQQAPLSSNPNAPPVDDITVRLAAEAAWKKMTDQEPEEEVLQEITQTLQQQAAVPAAQVDPSPEAPTAKLSGLHALFANASLVLPPANSAPSQQ